jgi:UDP-2,3-diacylglucosamine pyrophosphatase LpxH
MHYKSIFISDVHLGTNDCKAEELNNFLKHNTCDTLYLVGDIIDAWKIQQNRWKWRSSHSDVIRKILKAAKKGTKVIYIAGNHDEFLRPLISYDFTFGNVEVHNQYSHTGVDGKKYLITHGDLFDGITKVAPWLSFLGDKAYDFILAVNTKYNRLRHAFGFGYWSISKYLKLQIKRAVNFIFQFENNLVDYCRRKGYDGVICGHIHTAQIKNIDGIIYMNDGDWVESCTALVEHIDGKWEIVTWNEIQ